MWLRVAEGGDEQEQLRARLFRVQGQLKRSLEDIKDISQPKVLSRARKDLWPWPAPACDGAMGQGPAPPAEAAAQSGALAEIAAAGGSKHSVSRS